MPRAFDSDDVLRASGASALRFTENVTCPVCGCMFEGVFFDDSGSTSVEDIVDPPEGLHDCPECPHSWVSTATGWTFFSEAG